MVGENLPRAKSDMIHSINEFAVTEAEDRCRLCLIVYLRHWPCRDPLARG